MQRKSIIIATAVVAAVGAGALAFGTSSFAQPYHGGWGYMGPGMMGGYGPGPGGPGGPGYGPGRGYGPGWMHGWMHGRGYGPGWMHGGRGYGPCWGDGRNDGRAGGPPPPPPPRAGQTAPQHKLTTDDVKTRMERWLSYRHNPRLKVGDVKQKDDNTITADIVTVDNSLVQRFTVDRNTGYYRPTQDKPEKPAKQEK